MNLAKRPLSVHVDGDAWSTHMATVEDCIADREAAVKDGHMSVTIHDADGNDITDACLNGELR